MLFRSFKTENADLEESVNRYKSIMAKIIIIMIFVSSLLSQTESILILNIVVEGNKHKQSN